MNRIRLSAFVLTLLAATIGSAQTSLGPQRCEIVPLAEHQVSFQIDGVEKTRWHYGTEYPRPFFFPFNGPGGSSLTRMGHPGASNHDHHRSIWFAHHKLAGSDFWSDGSEAQVRQKMWYAYADGQTEAVMACGCGWFDAQGRELMQQELVAALIPLPDGEHALELQLTLRPPSDDSQVEMEQTNFGLLAVRVAKSISAHFGGGRLTNSEGAVGEADIFGKPARWMDYSGPMAIGAGDAREVVTEGITYFDHPTNPRYPTHWHVRSDGWMGASFNMQESFTITAEQPLVLRYLLHAHRGGYDPDKAARVEQDFTERPGFVVSKSDKPHQQYEVTRVATDSRLESFDRLIAAFMEQHEVPGLSLAVTNQGKLIYARGYGLAEIESRRQVTPESLFRIASLSKPITAVAILQLVEQGKLSLDSKVFKLLDHEAEIAELEKFDQRLRLVTIEQLLQHRGGWDRDASFDAMFRSVRFAKELGVEPPAGTDTVIRAMLRRKLDFDPGAKYAYSNFGYCLLGRVIEQVSGQEYEAYVKQHVLEPLGIQTMQIGRTLPEGRLPAEVHYYDPGQGKSVFAKNLGQEVPAPYGAWHLEAMDAHGGWLATASDLARFAAAFDSPEDCPILQAESIERMFAPAAADREQAEQDNGYYYSLGWSNRVVSPGVVNHWHTGSLPGTTATMIRRHDGRNFIALINTRHTKQEESIHGALDRLLHEAADCVEQWPH